MMNRNITLIILLWALLFYPFMQMGAQEGKNVPIVEPVKPLDSSSMTLQNSLIQPDSSLPLPVQYANFYYRYNPVLNSSLEFQKSTSFYLNYSMSSTEIIHIGLGNYRNVGAMLKWAPVSSFALEGGTFISLQYGYLLSSRHTSIGYNGKLKFDITHKFQLNIYGQYMVNDNQDIFVDYSSLFPKTHIGTSLEYKPQDNSKIGIGMEYQYDQQNKKWTPETRGKVSLGF